MKRMIIAMSVICLLGSVALADYPGTSYPIEGPIPVPGDPTEFTISNADLATWDIFKPSRLSATDTDSTVPGIGWDVPGRNNAEFNFIGFNFTDPDLGNVTWASGQVGWSMFTSDGGVDDTLPPEYYNLSGYKSFTVSFHNEVFGPVQAGDVGAAVMASLFINTGWTDIGEPDKYFQSDWVWAVPCDNLVLELDFANAIVGWDSTGQPIYGPVTNLGHVSSIGVHIGSNLYVAGVNWGIPDDTGFKICIDTVPLPGAALLAFLGLGYAGTKLRKFV